MNHQSIRHTEKHRFNEELHQQPPRRKMIVAVCWSQKHLINEQLLQPANRLILKRLLKRVIEETVSLFGESVCECVSVHRRTTTGRTVD